MNRVEIVEKLRELIAEGKLQCKAKLGKAYHSIDRGVQKGVFFVTPYRALVASDKEAQIWFNKLVDEGRIMDFLQVQMRKDILTNYDANKACMRGEMIKFDDFGRGCVLFID